MRDPTLAELAQVIGRERARAVGASHYLIRASATRPELAAAAAREVERAECLGIIHEIAARYARLAGDPQAELPS